MTINEIKNGLKFTIEMFLFEPHTGESYTEPRNDMDKTTIDACKGALKVCDALEKIKSEVGSLSTAWEYGQGVEDCYAIIEKCLKEVEE